MLTVESFLCILLLWFVDSAAGDSITNIHILCCRKKNDTSGKNLKGSWPRITVKWKRLSGNLLVTF